MNFFDLVNISERYMEVLNPSTPEKMLQLGQYLGLKPGSRVIDFGCGYAETLVLWAERYGITGIGVEIRPHACERARKKLLERGLAERIEIVCTSGSEYAFEAGAFDAATCLGATFIWRGYRPTLQALRRAVKPGGRLAVGEPYWLHEQPPAAYAERYPEFFHEAGLLRVTRQEGFEIEFILRSSLDDWDRYETGNWHALIRWLEENPDHPERQEVIDHLHRSQEEYLTYIREHLGWAMYVLAQASYRLA